MPNLRIRPATLSDSPFPRAHGAATADEVFILDRYWKTWRKSPWAGTTPNNWAMALAIETLQQLVERGAQILVLDSPEYDTLVGFVVFERTPTKGILHYVYVKPRFAGSKVPQLHACRQLLEAAKLPAKPAYTHRTPDSRKLRLGPHRPEWARLREVR